MSNKRLVYIDCFRGLAMLMVVYSHVLTFCLNNAIPSPLGLLFRKSMLPSFFFISGFCSYSQICGGGAIDMIKKIWGKTKSILIPAIVMFLLYMYYSHKQPLVWIFSYDKVGYWFTLVLFQIFTIFYVFRYVAFKFSNQWIRLLILICGPMSVFETYQIIIGYDNSLSILLEIVKVKEYFPIFYIGLLSHWFYPQLKMLFNDNIFNAVLFIFFILLYFNPEIVSSVTTIMSIILVFFIMYILQKLNNWLSNDSNIVGKTLSLIGKNSLAVYFLHYFLLFNIPIIGDWLMQMKSDTCFGMMHSCDSLIELIVCGSISIFISIICVWISKILRLFPYVSMLCLGSTHVK